MTTRIWYLSQPDGIVIRPRQNVPPGQDKPGKGGGGPGKGGPGRGGPGQGGPGQGGGGGGGPSVPAATASYDTITAAEIGNSEATAAERSIPDGVTNLTLSSDDLQGTTVGAILQLQLGFNDGVSTTWYNAADDYRSLQEIDASNAVTNVSSMRAIRDILGASLTRPHAWSLSADCLHLAVPSTIVGCEYYNDGPPGASTDGAFLTHVMTDPVPVNRYRVFFVTTTGGSGSIRVKYETRPVVLIEATDMSAVGNTHDIDVTGYSSVRMVTLDTVVSAVSGGIGLQVSTDGVTYLSTAGDYKWTYEAGGATSNSTTSQVLVPDGTTDASKAFTCEVLNLDVAAPTLSQAANMEVASGRPLFWSMSQSVAVHTHLRMKLPGATTGVSGTVYWVGDTTPSVLIDTIAMTEYTDPGTLAANPNPTVSHDVSAYGRLTFCAFTATVAETALFGARVSDDNAATFETAGYAFKLEDGSSESQRSEASLLFVNQGTAGTSTDVACMMQMENVSLEAPLISWGAHFSVNGKAGAMHKPSAPVTHFGMIWLNATSTDHVAGSTGTAYLVGRA